MHKKINIIIKLITILLVYQSAMKTFAQKEDIWSDYYKLSSSKSTTIDTLKITKTKDANKNKVASKYETDLERWHISSKNDNHDNKIEARRFLYDKQTEENEYEQFGWTDLYENEEMKCLDAGHIFICKTTPNSEVIIDNESFFTKTGIFGIRIHYGLFMLERIENP